MDLFRLSVIELLGLDLALQFSNVLLNFLSLQAQQSDASGVGEHLIFGLSRQLALRSIESALL